MWCHLLLAAPAWALAVFLFLPFPVALPLYVLIVVGSLILYRYIWRSMQRPPITGPEALIGREGIALEEIRRQGLVRCCGDLWTAIAERPIQPGQRVRVQGVQGNKLLVHPVEGAESIVSPGATSCHQQGGHAHSG